MSQTQSSSGNDPERMARVREMSERQVRAYEASNGARENTSGDGYPIVIVTSTGAKSGEPRKFPVIRVEHEGQYAVVASIGGMPKNPAWYYNLKAHPSATLQDGPSVRTYAVHEAEGEERAEWWERSVAAFPPYGTYQTRTERRIPVFIFTPAD